MYYNLGIPSMYAHILNGIFVFTALLFVIWNIPNLQKIDNYKKIIILFLVSISIGIHGISHHVLDTRYYYNNTAHCRMSPKCVRFAR